MEETDKLTSVVTEIRDLMQEQIEMAKEATERAMAAVHAGQRLAKTVVFAALVLLIVYIAFILWSTR